MQLTLDRLSKHYGNKLSLESVSLGMKHGIYGLLGANGAGKTTMLRLICGIISPSSGEVLVNERNISEMGEGYRAMLGYLPQDFGYYPDFSALKFMLYISSLKGIGRNTARIKSIELLDLVGLLNEKDKKIKTFSGGMKQRLGIAQALLNDPEILILDEPTAGLDPKERIRFRNLISSFSNEKIVLLSTHIVSDVENIANQIIVLKKGRLIENGQEAEIVKTMEGRVWECAIPYSLSDEFCAKYAVANIRRDGTSATLRVITNQRPDCDAISVTPCLEDFYLYHFKDEGEGDHL